MGCEPIHSRSKSRPGENCDRKRWKCTLYRQSLRYFREDSMSANSLFKIDAPRIHVVPKPIDDRLPHIWPVATLPAGAVMRRVRGKKMRIAPRMFDEFAA